MSIDQKVACHRAPKLPNDLPRAMEWRRDDHKGAPIHVFSDRGWRISVMVYVTLEPAGAPPDGVDLMMAILEMLAKTCDGIVLPN